MSYFQFEAITNQAAKNILILKKKKKKEKEMNTKEIRFISALGAYIGQGSKATVGVIE